MAKYTFENLIINPENPSLENLIGKEVYYSNTPILCIENANEDFSVGVLEYVRKCEPSPFFVNTSVGCILNYNCIIPKREREESKPEYVPFKNVAEFLYAYSYTEIKNPDGVHYYLDTPGIWLKYKSAEVNVYSLVFDIWDNGLAIRNKLNTDRTIAFSDTVSWDELCKDYTFLDGTPCGRLKEEPNG